MEQIFSDPELMKMMEVMTPSLSLSLFTPSPQDPEVMTAFMDLQKNPENAKKYEHNQKVHKVMEKLSAKLGMSGVGQGASKPRPPPAEAAASSSAKPPTADMDLD